MLEPSETHPVVACWRGPESAPAVHLALAFAGLLRQQLILATAYDYAPATLSPAPTTEAENEARQREAAAALDAARTLAPDGVEVAVEAVPAIDIPEALRDLAKTVDAAMLVAARDRAGHDLVASTVRHSPCPIAVTAPTDDGDGSRVLAPRHIGVAYDDTDAARKAVRVARHLAARSGGRVELLCVDADPGPWPTLVESGAALDVDVEPRRLHGDPATALRAAAADLDLLVCGTHGRGRLSAALLGSVSRALLQDCPCALLLVPAPARRRAATPLGVTTAAF